MAAATGAEGGVKWQKEKEGNGAESVGEVVCYGGDESAQEHVGNVSVHCGEAIPVEDSKVDSEQPVEAVTPVAFDEPIPVEDPQNGSDERAQQQEPVPDGEQQDEEDGDQQEQQDEQEEEEEDGEGEDEEESEGTVFGIVSSMNGLGDSCCNEVICFHPC